MKEESFENILDNINELNIIDIRDNYLYVMESVPNSINVPMNFLLVNPRNYLDVDKTYYLYCNSGYNSRIVSDKLNRLGFDTISLIGGYNEYKALKHLIK